MIRRYSKFSFHWDWYHDTMWYSVFIVRFDFLHSMLKNAINLFGVFQDNSLRIFNTQLISVATEIHFNVI